MTLIPRAEYVIPLVVVLGAVVLGASEFMVAFEFVPAGGEPLRDATNADRHGYAMLVLAVSCLVALAGTLLSGARVAAVATAGLGGIALLLFLVVDLPDANKLGDLDDPLYGLAAARAEPQPGFWLEGLGAAALAFGGGALLTLSEAQLLAPLARWRRRGETEAHGAGAGAGAGGSGAAGATGERMESRTAGAAGERADGGPADSGRDRGSSASRSSRRRAARSGRGLRGSATPSSEPEADPAAGEARQPEAPSRDPRRAAPDGDQDRAPDSVPDTWQPPGPSPSSPGRRPRRSPRQ